jgi:phosphinothricin acetyltransferase
MLRLYDEAERVCEDRSVIRHAEADRDAPACAEVYAQYVRGSVVSFEETPPTAEQMATRIARIQATHPWLVAERDGRVVGFAYGSLHHERAAYRWAADVSVYVHSAHHRLGLGRALYQALLAMLREQRLQIACAGVTLPNDASVGLHEALGFERVGVYRQIGYKAGAWHDVGWWQLRLTEADGPPAEPLAPPP